MSADSPSPRLLHLLARVSDGSIDPREAAELNETLRSDRGARIYYRRHVAVHMALRKKVSQSSRSEAGWKLTGFPVARRARRWPAFAAAAAAAVALAGGVTWWLAGSGQRGPGLAANVQMPAERPILAVASAVDDVRWNLEESAESGQHLGGGIVRLFMGNLSLLLAGGQTVHLKAPAEFELLPDGEFVLHRGPAAFRTTGGNGPFIVHLPKGALVDMGAEYAVETDSDGRAEVMVFENQLVASSVGASGRTVEEQRLEVGHSLLVDTRLLPGTLASSSFLRIPPAPLVVPPGMEETYATAVRASSPLAYWRFEGLDPQGQVADETGEYPLQLHEGARLSGGDRQGFLILGQGDASGYASPPRPIPALDLARGMAVECLVFPSKEYGSAVSIPMADPAFRPPGSPPSIAHPPHVFGLERMGRKGEQLGHIHPDFALRALFRSPAGYEKGINLYSAESHLMHRWIHVAAVRDGNRSLLYVDGKLSDSAEASLPASEGDLTPVIGRLHPNDHFRQWTGGIDEVAIYDRALTPEEVASHFNALKKN